MYVGSIGQELFKSRTCVDNGLGHRGAGASQDRTFGERAKVRRRSVAWGVVKRALKNQCWSQRNDVSVDSVIFLEFPGVGEVEMNPEVARAGGTSIVPWTPREYENWKSANYRLVAIKLMDAVTWCHR